MVPRCLGGCAIFFIKSFITSAARLTFFSSFVWEKNLFLLWTTCLQLQNGILWSPELTIFVPTDKLKSQVRNNKRECWIKKKKTNILIKTGIRTPLEWIFRQRWAKLNSCSNISCCISLRHSWMKRCCIRMIVLAVCAEHLVLQAGLILSFSQQLSVSSSLPSRQSSSPSHFHRAVMQRWLWHWNSSFLHGCGSELPPEASVRDRRTSMKYLFQGELLA